MIEIQLQSIIDEVAELKAMVNQLLNEKLELDNNAFLNSNEASLYLDISKSYMYRLTMDNTIPFYKPNGKKLYFKKIDLDNFLNSKKVQK
jgi:excisionase family DNA binding protein